jgi:nicotinamidase-related amidase
MRRTGLTGQVSNAVAAGRVSARGDRRVTVATAGTALLLIDVINDLAFDGATPLIEAAKTMSLRLAALKKRAVGAGIPVVYVNDNFGKWRSDFRRTVTHCTAAGSPGRVVSRRLRPSARDYFVLKPRHSGFYHTTLATLLRELQVRRVILTGIAGNICVLFTAHDAYMLGLKILAPADCMVSNTPQENEGALRQIEGVLKGIVVPSDRLTFRKPPPRRK